MEKKTYLYKLYDEEEYEDYYTFITTNMACDDLIDCLITLYQEHNFIDTEDEEFASHRGDLIAMIKKGLNQVYKNIGLEESNDFDNKAEEIVDDFIEDLDIIGNTEEYVVDTLRDLGIEVEYLEIDREIGY